MDICDCLCGWHMFNYPSSAITLRHNKSDRYSILEDCEEEARTTKNGEYGCLADTRVRSRRLDDVPSLVTNPGQSRQPLNPQSNQTKLNKAVTLVDICVVSCCLVRYKSNRDEKHKSTMTTSTNDCAQWATRIDEEDYTWMVNHPAECSEADHY